MPVPPQIALPDWCAQWERISTSLEEELSAPDPQVDRVVGLVRERQRVLNAALSSKPPTGPSREAFRAWLGRMHERDKVIVERAGAFKKVVGGFLESLSANEIVRKKLQKTNDEALILLDLKA